MKFSGQNSRSCFCFLLLLSLIVQSLVPTGFMPAQKKDGLFEIVICTSLGAATIMVDAAHAPLSDQQEKKNSDSHVSSCPYAPVLAYGLPLPDAGVLPFILPQGDIFVLAAHSTHSNAALKPWFSQGPPVFLTHA